MAPFIFKWLPSAALRFWLRLVLCCNEVNITMKLMPTVHRYLGPYSIQIAVSTHNVGRFNVWGQPLVADPLFYLNLPGSLTARKSLKLKIAS